MEIHIPKLRLYPTVVGINQYANGPASPLVNLGFAERDAQRFAQFLQEENESFESVSFQPFLGANATAERIRRELRLRFANARLTALDVIIFYFAGHGITTSDGKAFLCCYQASPRDPSNDGLRLDDLYNEMQIPDSEATVMLVLDACYSGSIADPNRVNSNAAQQMRSLLGRVQALGIGSRIIFAAAHSNQAARENRLLDDGGAGIFTSFVLRGWQQGAARKPDGAVTPGSLSEYLQVQFADSRDQQPVTSVTTGTNMVIGRFDPPVPGQEPVTPVKQQRSGVFDPNAVGVLYNPPPPSPRRSSGTLSKGRRNLIIGGVSAMVVAIAACAALTLISPFVFNLWFISAIVLAVLSLPLAARSGSGTFVFVALVVAVVQAVALIGLAHAHYALGSGLQFLDAVAQYAWLTVVIYIVHVLVVVIYGAWVTAEAMFST